MSNTTTLCWNCNKQYGIDLSSCPECGSANANADLSAATNQAEARENAELEAFERWVTTVWRPDDGVQLLRNDFPRFAFKAWKAGALASRGNQPHLCQTCGGSGSISTGIAEMGETLCNKCDGTGYT